MRQCGDVRDVTDTLHFTGSAAHKIYENPITVCVTVWGAASESSPNCESRTTVLTVSTLPAESGSSFGTLSLRANTWKRETSIETGARQKHRASMSKRREGGERNERLSDGRVEFDRSESGAAKGGGDFNISKDFLIAVCDTLLTQLSAGHWQLHKLAERGFSQTGPLIRCVHVRHTVLRQRIRRKKMLVCANVDNQMRAHTRVGKRASFVLQDVVEWEECA